MKLKDFGIALIRTSIVPPAVGFLATFFLSRGINVETGYITAGLTILFSGLWYIILHGVEVLAKKEKVRKWAGIFLGYPKTPNYRPVGEIEISSENFDLVNIELGKWVLKPRS